jgi:probable HAF family extracellular repeat protein
MSWCVLAVAEAEPSQARLIPLGSLPGSSTSFIVKGLSPNGQWVVGFSESAEGTQAVVWSEATGLIALGDLPGGEFLSMGEAVADNGTVVGRGHSANVCTDCSNPWEAFRWTSSGGMVGMGDLPGGSFWSEATGISADGTVIVGRGNHGPQIGAPWHEAWRWTAQTGMVPLGRLYQEGYSYADGVSADGSVVVGESRNFGFYPEPFRWQNGIMTALGYLEPHHDYGYARAVSGDGQTVVGFSTEFGSGEPNHAFRWTAETGMTYLGDLPDGRRAQIARGVSHDGSRVVGSGQSGKAFIWDQEHGSRWIGQILVDDYGFDISEWHYLSDIRGISADGRTVAGTGWRYDAPGSTAIHGQSFLAYLPPRPCDLPGNVDGNCVVDARDGAAFPACMTGPAAPGLETSCHYADVDQDTDADLADFAALQRLVAGP